MSGVQAGKTRQGQQAWEQIAAEVCTGFREWRAQHPRATFKELERALDERLARVRVRLLADAAVQRAASDLRAVPGAARPVCPDCGGRWCWPGKQRAC